MADKDSLLEMRGISKSFPGVKALSKVDFDLKAGEVHALLGENGAGKSTLIKVLTGVYQKDEGTISLEGKLVTSNSPEDIQKMGISTVYQEVNLIPTLSIAENIFLGRQPKKMGLLNWKEINTRAKKSLERLNLHTDVTQLLSSFSVAIQQLVAVARGVDMSAKILILDEPTASLDTEEVENLFSVIKTLKKEGIGIIFITHFLDQVYEISDRITVMRNGSLVGQFQTKSLPKVELIAHMLGKELKAMDRKAHQTLSKQNGNHKNVPFLKVNHLGKAGMIEPFDLEIYKEEVVGITGLLGSGRTELVKLLFGIEKADTGEMFLNGKKISLKSPQQSIQNGFAYCPEDRGTDGIVGELSIKENIILALQAKRGWARFLRPKEQEKIANQFVKALSISTPNIDKPTKELSGGNQQKVILARWLASNPEFLLLDEPTRGIDVGAHAEIINLIMNLCNDGLALLVVSSELEEVVAFSDRIAVLRDRRKVTELTGEHISQNNIMHAIAERGE
jgi:monosaccharide-transporting ATPase